MFDIMTGELKTACYALISEDNQFVPLDSKKTYFSLLNPPVMLSIEADKKGSQQDYKAVLFHKGKIVSVTTGRIILGRSSEAEDSKKKFMKKFREIRKQALEYENRFLESLRYMEPLVQ